MAHVIITGGSSGIGAALARACVARGDDVSLVARSLDALEITRDSLKIGAESRVHVAAGDVTEDDSIREAIHHCEAALGPCETLITSAGIVIPARLEEQRRDDFEEQIRTNLFGTANAVRAVYDGMKARRRGKILMLGSGAGMIGLYGYTGYCASKYGVLGFAEALRCEVRPLGISVSICFPPDTETPQLAAELALRPVEASAVMGLGGIWKADDIARVALTGLERGRFAIYPGLQMKLLGRFGSLAMPFLRPWSDRKISAAQQKPTTSF